MEWLAVVVLGITATCIGLVVYVELNLNPTEGYLKDFLVVLPLFVVTAMYAVSLVALS